MLQTVYQLLSTFDVSGKINGRKKLQKVVHLLKHANHKYPFRYQYHHYGPYSAALQFEVNRLVEQDYIKEFNEQGAYQYVLTEKGSEFKKVLEEEGHFRFELNKDLLESLLEKESQFLEVVSTYAFLIESGDTIEQAKTKTKELKPHLSALIHEAILFYKEYFLQ